MQRNMPKTSSTSADSFGKKLLFDLANLSDNGASNFLKNRSFLNESSQTLYKVRDDLRQIWESARSSTSKLTDTLNRWVNYHHPGLLELGRRPWKVSLAPAMIVPDVSNLRGYLTFAVLWYLPLLAICGNPACPAKYFISRRRDQKFCGGECTAYAQRQYSLKYWNEEGKHRRTKRLEKTKRGK